MNILIPTIEARLHAARRALTLIAASGTGAEESGFYRVDVLAAIVSIAKDAHEEIFWTEKGLPATILNTAAPDDDQREEADAAARTKGA